MWITISNIADKFQVRLKIKRLFYAQLEGPEV